MKDGCPSAVASDAGTGGVVQFSGPYRLSGAWWDTQAWTIEEWDVELDDGGLFRIARRGRQWAVEGCYEA